MSYADSLLSTGERVSHRVRQHWFVLVWGARIPIAAIIAALLLLVLSGNVQDSTFRTFLGILTAVLFIGGLVFLAWATLRYLNTEFVLTNRRVVQVEGVVNKRATDSSLEKINDAVLTQSIFGRMFGFGDLDVLTASEEGIERLRMLRDAKDFKKAMIEAKHELEIEVARPVMPTIRSEPAPAAATPVAAPPAPVVAAPAAPAPAAPAAPASTDIGAALDRLGDLRDRGLITPEEYAAKRQELLDRL